MSATNLQLFLLWSFGFIFCAAQSQNTQSRHTPLNPLAQNAKQEITIPTLPFGARISSSYGLELERNNLSRFLPLPQKDQNVSNKIPSIPNNPYQDSMNRSRAYVGSTATLNNRRFRKIKSMKRRRLRPATDKSSGIQLSGVLDRTLPIGEVKDLGLNPKFQSESFIYKNNNRHEVPEIRSRVNFAGNTNTKERDQFLSGHKDLTSNFERINGSAGDRVRYIDNLQGHLGKLNRTEPDGIINANHVGGKLTRKEYNVPERQGYRNRLEDNHKNIRHETATTNNGRPQINNTHQINNTDFKQSRNVPIDKVIQNTSYFRIPLRKEINQSGDKHIMNVPREKTTDGNHHLRTPFRNPINQTNDKHIMNIPRGNTTDSNHHLRTPFRKPINQTNDKHIMNVPREKTTDSNHHLRTPFIKPINQTDTRPNTNALNEKPIQNNYHSRNPAPSQDKKVLEEPLKTVDRSANANKDRQHRNRLGLGDRNGSSQMNLDHDQLQERRRNQNKRNNLTGDTVQNKTLIQNNYHSRNPAPSQDKKVLENTLKTVDNANKDSQHRNRLGLGDRNGSSRMNLDHDQLQEGRRNQIERNNLPGATMAKDNDYLHKGLGNKTISDDSISVTNPGYTTDWNKIVRNKTFSANPLPIQEEAVIAGKSDGDSLPCVCFWSKTNCGCDCRGSLSYDHFQTLAASFKPCHNFSFSLADGSYFSLPPNLFSRIGRVENLDLRFSNSTFDYLFDSTPNTSAFRGVHFGQKARLEVRNVTARQRWNWTPMGDLNAGERRHKDKPHEQIPSRTLSNEPAKMDVVISNCGLSRLSSDFASVASGGRVETLQVSDSGVEMVGSGAFATFSGVVRFLLPRNRLRSIRRTDLPTEPRDLTEIDLSGNQLQSLDPDLFSAMPSLRVVSLAANPLQLLGENTFGHVIRNTHFIGLADFPLNCDCRLQWMKNSSLTHNSMFLENVRGAICKRPPHLRGTPFKDLNKEHLKC